MKSVERFSAGAVRLLAYVVVSSLVAGCSGNGGRLLPPAPPAGSNAVRPAIASRTTGPVVTSTADHGTGSLRSAVGAANDGDTIAFKLPNKSTIALTSPISISKTVTIAGPGVASGLTISGGGAHQVFVVSGSVTISGLIIRQGSATVTNHPGGAIANTGSLALVKDEITGNTSTAASKFAPHSAISLVPRALHPHTCTTTYAYGGGVYNHGQLISSGTTYASNVAPSDLGTCLDGLGGAIYNDVDGSISSTGDTFTNNSALMGGAVYNAGRGAANFTNDTFSNNTGCTALSGCPTSGCNNKGCTSSAQGQGAAIFDDGTGIVVANSSFTNNVAGGATLGSVGIGGAIVLGQPQSQPTITGSTFTGNQAGGGNGSCSTGNGGAIAAVVPFEADDDKFIKNRASGDDTSAGGAIFSSASVSGTNDTFTGNSAVATGSACYASSIALGGGVYSTVQATFTSSTFSSNLATGNLEGAGGALAAAETRLSGDAFTSNTAIATGAFGAKAVSGGGAVASSALGKIDGCTFTTNHASIHGAKQTSVTGGAVLAGGVLTSSGNTFTSNTIDATLGSASVSAGGALTLTGGTAVVTGDTYKSNVATGAGTAGGGAVYLAGSYDFRGNTVTGNSVSAPVAYGGALALVAGGSLSGDTITSNQAKTNVTNVPGEAAAGGGIYDNGGMTMTNSTVTNNTAATYGGGILATVSDHITNSTISGNTVSTASVKASGGGGIYTAVASLQIAQSTISGNTVTLGAKATQSGGGGIYTGGAGLLTLTGSTVSGNAVLGSAATSGGGGIFDTSNATLTDSTISGNSSSTNGGGVDFAANKAVEVYNVTLYQNKTVGLGGNILSHYAMTLVNSIVAGGKAAKGPDIYNAGLLTSGDYNIIQTTVAGNVMGGAVSHNLKTNPKLLPLAKNGGSTLTNADQATSPGTGYIPFTNGGNCGAILMLFDQRGYKRGFKNTCDVGAFEFNGIATSARPAGVVPAAVRPRSDSRFPPIRLVLPPSPF